MSSKYTPSRLQLSSTSPKSQVPKPSSHTLFWTNPGRTVPILSKRDAMKTLLFLAMSQFFVKILVIVYSFGGETNLFIIILILVRLWTIFLFASIFSNISPYLSGFYLNFTQLWSAISQRFAQLPAIVKAGILAVRLAYKN